MENSSKKEEKRGVRGHHRDTFSHSGGGPTSFTHLLLGKLSAQLAVFLQHVVHLGAVLAHRPLPQIDVAFALHWDEGGSHVLFIPGELLCLSHLLNFKKKDALCNLQNMQWIIILMVRDALMTLLFFTCISILTEY